MLCKHPAIHSHAKEMVERMLLSLVYDICEEEGDAEGLRALRRVMVSYFLTQVGDDDKEWFYSNH